MQSFSIEFNASPISWWESSDCAYYPKKYFRKFDSKVGQWNGIPMEMQKRKEERSEFRLCVGSHRIRVTVANKFELSCNIDRSFHRAISLSPALPSRSWIYWNFMRYPDEVRLENFIDGRWVAGSYITREKEGGRLLFRCSKLITFSRAPKRDSKEMSQLDGKEGWNLDRRLLSDSWSWLYIFSLLS